MKKNIFNQMLSIAILSPLKKIIELILENPYIFKLQQKFNDYEIKVIDDYSTDGGRELCKVS